MPAEALARARVLIADAMNFRTTDYRTDAVALQVYAFQVFGYSTTCALRLLISRLI